MHPLLKPKIWLIILRSIAVTLRVCSITIIDIYFGKFTREKGDKRLRHWSAKLLKIVNLKYTVVGEATHIFKPHQRYIIVSNHQSYFDIPLIFSAFNDCSLRMWAKKELFHIPVLGKAMEIGEFIAIDRSKRGKAAHILEETKKKMDSGITIWIAPEGTCSKTGALLPLKKGGFLLAIQMGAILLPVGIQNSKATLPAKSINFSTHQHADIHIGEMIDCSQYQVNDLAKLTRDVEESLLALLIPK